MPTYVYECTKCGDEFELYQSFSDEKLKKHPECGGKVAKVFQPVGIVLKGSGFYKNDSRNGNGKRAKTDGSGDSSKSDSKSETKSETKSDSTSTTSDSSGTKGDGAKNTGKSSEKKVSTPAGTST